MGIRDEWLAKNFNNAHNFILSVSYILMARVIRYLRHTDESPWAEGQPVTAGRSVAGLRSDASPPGGTRRLNAWLKE